MTSLKIKDIDGRLSPTRPDSPIGPVRPGCIVREVVEVPSGTDAAEVVRLLDHTIDWTFILGRPRYRFAFAELGVGVQIRA